jgi:hypothetical protein
VHDFQAERASSRFAVTSEAYAALQLRLLLRRKIEKPQRQEAGSIRDPHEHLAAATNDDLGELYFPLNNGSIAGPQRADRENPGTVLVPKGQ